MAFSRLPALGAHDATDAVPGSAAGCCAGHAGVQISAGPFHRHARHATAPMVRERAEQWADCVFTPLQNEELAVSVQNPLASYKTVAFASLLDCPWRWQSTGNPMREVLEQEQEVSPAAGPVAARLARKRVHPDHDPPHCRKRHNRHNRCHAAVGGRHIGAAWAAAVAVPAPAQKRVVWLHHPPGQAAGRGHAVIYGGTASAVKDGWRSGKLLFIQ